MAEKLWGVWKIEFEDEDGYKSARARFHCLARDVHEAIQVAENWAKKQEDYDRYHPQIVSVQKDYDIESVDLVREDKTS